MSALGSLLERLQRAYGKIAEIEIVAARHPGDRYVLANLDSLRRDATSLERAWDEECRHAQKEVCRYKLLAQRTDQYQVRYFSQSLLNFQELFSQIYDAKKTGSLKSRARISPEIASETAFNFGFAYPGSLGIAMTVSSQAELFASKYDETVNALLEILSLRDEAAVRSIAKAFGLAVVRRAYAWSRVNASAGYAVDINWTTSRGHQKGAQADVEDFSRIVEIIGRVSDVERARIEVAGTLLGIDAHSRRFRFAAINEQTYSGPLGDTFPSEVRWAINTNYVAEIESEATTRYASEDASIIYRLRNLRQTDRSA